MMNRRMGLLAIAAAAIALAGCNDKPQSTPASGGGGAGSAKNGPSVGVVFDTGGVGDLSFNMMADQGVKRAEKELGVKPLVLESAQAADYAPNLEKLAGKDCKIVFAIGFALEDAVKEAAKQFPNTQFVIIDTPAEGVPNVTGVTFREQEGSFLAGALAGGMTKKDSLGFVGGKKIPLIEKFEAGFRAGAQTTNPKASVTAKYTNDWEKVDLGKELALSLFDQGADVVMHASGRCGLGVIEAVKEKGPGYWVIGVDADQDYLGTADTKNPQPPSRVLTSMMKRVDNAVYEICKEVTDGSFKPGHREFGVKEDGVGLSPMKYTKSDVPEALLKEVERLKGLIATGELKPPKSLKELEGWKAPAKG